jgi:hypothetical protein
VCVCVCVCTRAHVHGVRPASMASVRMLQWIELSRNSVSVSLSSVIFFSV